MPLIADSRVEDGPFLMQCTVNEVFQGEQC